MGVIKGTNETPPHWLGTDQSGLDIFSRLIAAPRTDITIALAGALVSLALGTLIGLTTGFYRNWMTELVMRISDVPGVSGFHHRDASGDALRTLVSNIVIALALVYTPIFVRLTRAEVMSQSARGYVEAARAAGNRPWIIADQAHPAELDGSGVGADLRHHRLRDHPDGGLSFVGAGVRRADPQWGLMISTGASQLILGE